MGLTGFFFSILFFKNFKFLFGEKFAPEFWFNSGQTESAFEQLILEIFFRLRVKSKRIFVLIRLTQLWAKCILRTYKTYI